MFRDPEQKCRIADKIDLRNTAESDIRTRSLMADTKSSQKPDALY